VEACDMAAKNLGNTRSVCRNYYVHPAIIEKYENGTLFKYLDKKRETTSDYDLEPIEQILMDVISRYHFEIGD